MGRLSMTAKLPGVLTAIYPRAAAKPLLTHSIFGKKYYPADDPIPFLLIETWNDYEEGYGDRTGHSQLWFGSTDSNVLRANLRPRAIAPLPSSQRGLHNRAAHITDTLGHPHRRVIRICLQNAHSPSHFGGGEDGDVVSPDLLRGLHLVMVEDLLIVFHVVYQLNR